MITITLDDKLLEKLESFNRKSATFNMTAKPVDLKKSKELFDEMNIDARTFCYMVGTMIHNRGVTT